MMNAGGTFLHSKIRALTTLQSLEIQVFKFKLVPNQGHIIYFHS